MIIFKIIGLASIYVLKLVYSFAFRFNPDFPFYAYFILNYLSVLIAKLVLYFITY